MVRLVPADVVQGPHQACRKRCCGGGLLSFPITTRLTFSVRGPAKLFVANNTWLWLGSWAPQPSRVSLLYAVKTGTCKVERGFTRRARDTLVGCTRILRSRTYGKSLSGCSSGKPRDRWTYHRDCECLEMVWTDFYNKGGNVIKMSRSDLLRFG